MNHLSIRKMADAVPGCNLLVKTWKGTVIYNGPYDKLPDHLLDKIPHSYLYAPMEKTIKIRMPKAGDIYDETPEDLLNMMVIDKFTDPQTFTTIIIIDI